MSENKQKDIDIIYHPSLLQSAADRVVNGQPEVRKGVIDDYGYGRAHPVTYLAKTGQSEALASPRMHNVLEPIYQDFQRNQDQKTWLDPFQNQDFIDDGLEDELSADEKTLAKDYISWLQALKNPVAEVPAGETDIVPTSLEVRQAEKLAEVRALIGRRARHAGDPASGRHKDDSIQIEEPPLRPRSKIDA